MGTADGRHVSGGHNDGGDRVRVLAAGDDAVLVEFPDSDGPVAPAVLPFVAAAAHDRPPGVVDVIPAARTAAVTYRAEKIAAHAVREWCADLAVRATSAAAAGTGTAGAETAGAETAGAETAGAGTAGGPAEPAPEEVVLPVVYDGPDLDAVSAATGLSKDEVIDAHTGTAWTVAFTGFAPGFGYLVGGDPRLAVPRRTTPRTRVPAGSVGLAGPFSGVYPRPSPGGWQLIGTTAAELWQPRRDAPALLAPGVRVRFERQGPAA
ncbi:5-oxoprolinase subunit B family protein [Tomitella fengzijianii]|uniref:Allophanate hydrolase subunit 1 n=1 Tax=Tomitella fengzijianii TaxID=2597660 RepID=A0A516X598_9ACTN|nr:allophanate hydrolase subunit 1 [Tomitella fengzijianii]QDQ98247.1 allophanate hydrolase subunit 1 [Tomitella fengzijianii]